ncbi:MAG TPA: hypothetical protein VGK67_23405 [Myxococcales bacterium]|jgi:hypothetical protein
MKVQPEAAAAVPNAQTASPAKTFAEALRAGPGRPVLRTAGTAKPGALPAKPGAVAPKPGALPAKPGAAKPPTTGSKPAAPGAKPASSKAAAAITQLRTRAAAQVQRGAADSRTKSSRQLAASRSIDQVHASAHAASAQASNHRQVERAEDRVRVGLFQAIERECAVAPVTQRADRDTGSSPSPRAQSQAESGRGHEIQPTAATEAPATTSTSPQRAESVAALVERIEAALKNGQPTLSLGLADRSGASSIEISRTGKGEVAVRIAARPGKKTHLEAAGEEIKTALAARGLRLKSLTVG